MLRAVLPILLMLVLVFTGCQAVSSIFYGPADDNVYRGYQDEARFLLPYELFLLSRRQYHHAHGIDSLLASSRYPNGYPSIRDSIDLRERAYHLAMDGVTVSFIEELAGIGVDLPSMDWRRQRVGQAVTSEIVVRARVVGERTDRNQHDDFRSTLSLAVEEIYRGMVPLHSVSGFISLRRRSGETESGRVVRDRSELELVPGRSYIFFLSRALYQFERNLADTWAMDFLQMPSLAPVEHTRTYLSDPGFVLERYPPVRLEWLPEDRREELLDDIRRATSIRAD